MKTSKLGREMEGAMQKEPKTIREVEGRSVRRGRDIICKISEDE